MSASKPPDTSNKKIVIRPEELIQGRRTDARDPPGVLTVSLKSEFPRIRTARKHIVACASLAAALFFLCTIWIAWITISHPDDCAHKTLAYWQRMTAILEQGQQASDNSANAVTAQLRSVAKEIENVSTVGVDPDAVDCFLQFAVLLNEVADTVEHENSFAAIAVSFLRGMAGDPFGSTRENLETHASLEKQRRDVRRKVTAMRAALSNRYGIEFRAIRFD